MPYTLINAVNELAAAFGEAGVDSPRLDARLLVAHVLQIEPVKVFTCGRDSFPETQRVALDTVKARRVGREPVGRIRGFREFYGHDFVIGPETLEPRPDSETLVEAVLKFRAAAKLPDDARVLDLGTGSGCLLLSILAAWPHAKGVGLDIAPGAVEVAQANAQRLGLAARAQFQVGDWYGDVAPAFDVIVSNPPYIARSDLALLQPEVQRFDPVRALDGGEDGLEAYRAFVPGLRKYLAPGGAVFLEVGFDQASAVAALCVVHGLPHTVFHHDLAGIARVVEAGAN